MCVKIDESVELSAILKPYQSDVGRSPSGANPSKAKRSATALAEQSERQKDVKHEGGCDEQAPSAESGLPEQSNL